MVNDEPSLIIYYYHDVHEKSWHSSFFLKRLWEWPPLSSRGGGNQRETSPWPLFYISPFSKESFSSTSREPSYFYECLNGGGGKGCRSPKERQNNFPMSSTKPFLISFGFLLSLFSEHVYAILVDGIKKRFFCLFHVCFIWWKKIISNITEGSTIVV